VNHLLDERALQADLVRTDWISSIAASLEAEILVLRHQLNVLRRKSPKRPTFGSIESADICRAVWRGTLDDRRAILTSIASTSESPPGANELRFLA
jgi:hypothetical protein